MTFNLKKPLQPSDLSLKEAPPPILAALLPILAASPLILAAPLHILAASPLILAALPLILAALPLILAAPLPILAPPAPLLQPSDFRLQPSDFSLMKYPIHIAFCVSDNYVQYICVTIKSIIENHKDKDVTIHVLSDVLSDESIRRLNRTIGKDSTHIHLQIHYVDDTPLQGLTYKTWTIYAWYRMLLPEILPDVERVLYLDADVIVENDLSYLFDVDMTDKSLAAAPDFDEFLEGTFERCEYPKEKGYVCSGVLLLNLDFWRKYDLSHKILEYSKIKGESSKYPDQDAINFVCQDTKLLLPLKYGITQSLLTQNAFYSKKYKEELYDLIANPTIVHYGGAAPWHRECMHPLKHIWLEYNRMVFKPVKVKFKVSEKGILGLKIRIYNLLHRNHIKPLSNEEVWNKIYAIED